MDRAKASAAAAAASWAEVSLAVDSVEALLHALRGQYEQYFLGMEKRPPSKAHEQFKKQLATLRTIPSRNSALSFRIQSLQATAATYERLWMRTLQEMEDGTYKRDVFKARLRRKSSPEVPAKPPPASTETSAATPGTKQAKTGKTAAAPETSATNW